MMLQVDTWPELRDPVLVISLSGWVDAGLAGSGSMAVLTEQLQSAKAFARVDLADLVDLQQHRPEARLRGGVTREVVWPSIELVAGRLHRDVVLMTGPEPSLRWRELCDDVIAMAHRLGVTRAVTLGGIPAAASHRRPISVFATVTDAALGAEVGAWPIDYQGPVGAQTVLQAVLGEAGIPVVSLWAQVPHYVAATPSPQAIRALLERLAQVADVRADTASVAADEASYVRGVDEGLIERPDVARILGEIEEGDEALPSGDELASEIERFLRDEG